MHLYIHEFHDPKDNKISEVRSLLFSKSLSDFQERTGRKVEELEISKGEHGKPYFASEEDLHFSISHSGKYWVCLFDKENVGVDIEDYSERNMTIKRCNDIGDRSFTDDEKAYALGNIEDAGSNDAPDEDTKNRFFRVWTAKEAYMKYTGNGFSEGFQKFSVLDGSLDVHFRNVPVDQKTVLTFCSGRHTNLHELINF